MVEQLRWNTIFMGKVTDIAFTSDFGNNYSHSASFYLTSPHPRPTCPHITYLMSSSPLSRVPNSQVPTNASSHFYTQEKRKKRGGKKVKRKSQDCCMWYEWYFSPKNYHESLLSAHAQTSQANILHWDQKAMKYTRVNSFVVSFSSL